jgi:sialate O-acetylesterase
MRFRARANRSLRQPCEFVLGLLALVGGAPVEGWCAGLSLGLPFSDNMVVQRDVPALVWGTAQPGTAVTVEFAGQGKSTTADGSGSWQLRLAPLAASAQPRTLTVTAGITNSSSALRLTNVLVGEVWLAAGQSNMEWPLASEAHAGQESPAATNDRLRLLNLPFAGQYFYGKSFGSNEVRRLTPESFFAGNWQPCTPSTASGFSAIAYYFGRRLTTELGVPVGLIHLAVGGSPAEAWIGRRALESVPSLKPLAAGNWLSNTNLDSWCRQRGHQNLDLPLAAGLAVPGDDLGPNHPFKPGFLYQAGIERLRPFALRGVLWYQGESNSLEPWRVVQHETLFPLLVRDWRTAWGGDFPFLFCQLSSISTNGGYKAANWPAFRDQQRWFLDTIPNVGMAVTSDLGHPTDVHPRNKRDVGHRLALWALAKTYGRGIEFSGPLPTRATARGEVVEVAFQHAASGLQTSDGKPVASFELAGEDGVFHPASAKLEGGRVEVSAAAEPKPRRVRYGWQPFSAGNLVNADGLPASTFQILAGSF